MSIAINDLLHRTEQGKDRRAAIKAWFEENPTDCISVDAKWCRQVHKDSDLKKLIKAGFLKKIRVHHFPHHSKSFLVKT